MPAGYSPASPVRCSVPRPTVRRFGAVVALSALLLALPACSRNADTGPQSVVHGKVLYNGQPVIYGVVLFYELEHGLDPKSGIAVPMGVTEIKNGKYEVVNCPTGLMKVCVATDPDAPRFAYMGPAKMADPLSKGGPGGPKGPPGDPKGGPPMEGDGGPGAFPKTAGNPETEKLTAEQKRTLREIHFRFGDFLKSPLIVEVKGGDQTFDIDLR